MAADEDTIGERISEPPEPNRSPDAPAEDADGGEYATLANELHSEIAGDVRFDEYSQILYATDGSIYQARPAGVVVPRSVEDVRAVVRIASEHGTPILARGAGSSLAGQAVGPGCVVVDLSTYMDDIVSIDPDEKRATVQPGVVQDDLDAHLAEYGLKFAPDPASSNRATIGGAVGNNSTGAHSVRYGITDAYTEELDVVLADGSLIHTREIVVGSDEWDAILAQGDLEAELYRTVTRLVEKNADEIEARYPDLKRNVSGYNLDRVVFENERGETVVNLSKLFVGAEGTLGIVVEATLSLVTTPETTALALYCFDDLDDAMAAVPEALEFDPSAVELMDEEVFRLARDSGEFAEYAAPIPLETAAALMLEFDSEEHDDLEAAVDATNRRFRDDGNAFEVLEAYGDESQRRLWKLRKAAIPLLMSLEGDPKPYPFIEDATVPPAELADYVRRFEEILEDHGTSAAYFAHAGSGTLHIRPILNLKAGDDIQTMRAIADDVTDLVVDHHGSFSGEHGDGLARTEFNPKMYGPQLWDAFQELKSTFDPDWLLNPGKVVFQDDEPTDMREHLRYGAEYASIEPNTTLDFADEGGYSESIELCNGCGTCRQTGSDTMCPTYRATGDEIATTRGRANLLRAAISGELPEDERYSEYFQREVLDLCIGCKGCQNDCPTGVDLAKLKAETKHQYHQREGSDLREKLFANIDRAARLGSALAPLSNVATKLPGSRALMDRALGIAPDRDLPTFTRETFEDWFDDRESPVDPAEADYGVVLFPDTDTNYVYPDAGKAAVRVLETAGVHVELLDDLRASGRAAYSMGFLDQARERAEHNVDVLAPYVDRGWSVVFVEPSDAVVFQDEYADLLDGEAVSSVGANAYGISEFIDTYRLDESLDFDVPLDSASTPESLVYHGHCNQKALNRDHHAVGLLRRAGYAVDPLDSGCCGMAGSFGYESEHYELSKSIGQLLFEQVEASDADSVVAPGVSCRSQLADRAGGTRPPHPIEKVADALERGR
ncbi:FAD-binding protein [Halobacteria archaeon AArc-m2/3/4]|uniref:FAD-binding protein n=1 Tax=Natronoglomus mannanivorans TaxID=2979990 RepID=A0ABT2QL36_9EURY|nr:FAD-binding protein [Halobacteria archaeon AArc-m2/3/4]